MTCRRCARGFGLIPLLVGLAIGAGLLLGAGELVVAAQETARWQAAVVGLERAGQRALDFLTSELRAAGFRGGVVSAPAVPDGPGCAAEDGWALQLYPALLFADRGRTDDTTLNDGTVPACLPLDALQAGSDLLVVRRTAQVASGLPSHKPSRRLRETQWYLSGAGMGSGAFIYRDTEFEAGAAPADRPIWEWRTGIFFVRNYSVVAGDNVPALCVERLAGARMRSECLVEGVLRLHAEFLNSTATSEAVSLASPTAQELASAQHVTVFLHLRSVRALRSSSKARILRLGRETVTVPAGDPYLHRVFVRTIPLDNTGFNAGPRL